ncbi:MAG: GNAT family N-acetyltransferase [Gammaproteobacteria bacterium]
MSTTDQGGPTELRIVRRLETERLRLRCVTANDANVIARLLFGDPQVARNLWGNPDSEQAQAELARVAVGRWEEEWLEGRRSVNAVLTKDESLGKPGRVIGVCGFQRDEVGTGVELVYALARPYWGLGLATEAARACVKSLFEQTRVAGFEAVVPSRRERQAIAVAIKLGAHHACDMLINERLDDREQQLAYQGALHRLRAAPAARQWKTLDDAAFRLGQLVACRVRDEATAAQDLMRAAQLSGLGRVTAQSSLTDYMREALSAGIRDPNMLLYSRPRPRT